MLWDLIVVGAGPAGCAAALSALAVRADASVLILDRADFPRDKACGDGISPHALDVLDRLDVHGIVDDYRPVHRLRLGYPGGEEAIGRMQRPMRVVPRAVLDARLLQEARSRGACFVRHAVRTAQVHADRVVLDARWTGRVVVGADGAGSVVRRGMGMAPSPSGHVALAIRGYAPETGTASHEQRIVFDRGDWPAYAWSFPVGDGSVNVGYGCVLRAGRRLTRAQLLRDLDRLLPGAAVGAERWRAHHLPLSSHRARQPDGRLLLAGDALSLVNPLSGEGIFAAIASGATAGAAALAKVDPGATYRAALQRQLGRHWHHSLLAVLLARRPAWVDAVLRAGRNDSVVFDDLVALSMGGGTFTPYAVRALLRARLQTVRVPR